MLFNNLRLKTLVVDIAGACNQHDNALCEFSIYVAKGLDIGLNNIQSMKVLWKNPVQAMVCFNSSGLFSQTD